MYVTYTLWVHSSFNKQIYYKCQKCVSVEGLFPASDWDRAPQQWPFCGYQGLEQLTSTILLFGHSETQSFTGKAEAKSELATFSNFI